MVWACTSKQAANTAFNIVNGDVFRWRWLWPRLAAFFDLEWEGPTNIRRPLAEAMSQSQHIWSKVVEKNGLVEKDVNKLASWWHTDADLGLTVDSFADMNLRFGKTFLAVSLYSLTPYSQPFSWICGVSRQRKVFSGCL